MIELFKVEKIMVEKSWFKNLGIEQFGVKMSCKSYEVLNVVMVVIIWFQTDVALGRNFWHYGSEVYGHYVRNDPKFDVMCNAFPTVVSTYLKMSKIGLKIILI